MGLLQLTWLDRHRDLAPLAIRAFLGVFLIYMSQDNVFSAARMAEFEQFLAANDFPIVEVSARVSVYAQFLGGIAILLGALTRWAAIVIAVNFVVAIVGVHWSLPFRTWLEPSAMLACAVFLALHGPGRFAIDTLRSGRR